MKNPFSKATEKRKYLKVLVYGESGVGKTHFALTFPKPAVIDLEAGTTFFSDRFKFDVLDTKSFSEVLNAIKFLEFGQHNYETLVIDPITIIWSALQDGRTEFKVRNPDKAASGEEKSALDFRDWGILKRFYSILMTKLINLPMHIVLIGRQKDDTEIDSKGNIIRNGVKSDNEKSTPYLTDVRLRIAVNGKRFGYFEKDRTGAFPPEKRIENPSFEHFKPILEKVNAEAPIAITQDASDAAEKDCSFFEQGGSIRNDQVITLEYLTNKILSLGLSDYVDTYNMYICQKYNIAGMDLMSDEQRQEQAKLMYSCRKPERLTEFKKILSRIKNKESEGVKAPF